MASRAGCRARLPTKLRLAYLRRLCPVAIGIARRLYAGDPFGVDLKETVYALDASTIDLCLSVFSWAPFRSTKAAIKLHTLLDLRGNIPSSCTSATANFNVLDLLLPESGAFYIMETTSSGFITFTKRAAFVTRAKSNEFASSRPEHGIDLRSDHRAFRLLLAPFDTPLPIQRPRDRQTIGVPDQQLRLGDYHHRALSSGGRWSCFSNGSSSLYQSFFGTSENAVKPNSGSSRSTCERSSRSG